MSQPHGNSNEWRINTDQATNTSQTNGSGTWDGTATNLLIKAAPATGLSLYLTDVTVVQGATSRLFTVMDGSSGTVLFKSALTLATATTLVFQTPIKLTAATGLYLTSAGGSVGAMMTFGGFTAF